jgi:hypothetical protein
MASPGESIAVVEFAIRRGAAHQAPLCGISGRSWAFRASAANVTPSRAVSVAVTRPRAPICRLPTYQSRSPRDHGVLPPPGSTGSRKLLGKGYYLASSRFRRRTKLRHAGANHTAAREPRISQTPTWDADRALCRIRELEHLPGALLPILHALQAEFGYIDSAAVPLVARALTKSLSRRRARRDQLLSRFSAHAPRPPCAAHLPSGRRRHTTIRGVRRREIFLN